MGASISNKLCVYIKNEYYVWNYPGHWDRGSIEYYFIYNEYYVSLGANSNYKHSVNSYINNKDYVLIYIFYVHYGDIEYYSIYDMLKVPNYVSLLKLDFIDLL